MVHNSRYGDSLANPSRPPFSTPYSQSFTAGSNPNSAPMPNPSGHRRRSNPAASGSLQRSFSPLPEPSFDLMSSSSAPSLFNDMTYHHQMPNPQYAHHQGPISAVDPAPSPYDLSALPAPSFPVAFDSSSSAEHFLAHPLPAYDPATSPYVTAGFAAAMNGPPNPSLPQPTLAPSPAKLKSPFSSNGPILAPPLSTRHASATDSILKNSPQTPQKLVRPKSAAAARNPPLLPAPTGLKTPPRVLDQRDSNAHALKRHLPDSPTLETSSPRKATKRCKTDEPARHRQQLPLPDGESFPEVDPGDDHGKPPYTYAQMIALAIWKAPSRRRTLAQIYDFIRKTWCYYRKDDTWENSIRHNLSLHKKFFEKQARTKDDPGKGNYWLIISGNERELLDVYLKERSGTETSILGGKNIVVTSPARLEPSALPPPHKALQSFPDPMLPPSQLPCFQLHVPLVPKLQPPARILPEPSSDATIPVSDQAFAGPESMNDAAHREFHALDTTLTSSPPPCISAHAPPMPGDTPTRAARIGGSSGRTSAKRKRYSMVDSGYMTGLESSTLRYGNQQRALPVFSSSEADPHQFHGGGRAEDAIRKLRASSPTSPSKVKSRIPPASSSPVGRDSPLRYRASTSAPSSAAAKTPANGKRSVSSLNGATTLAPPKTTSKYNTSPIRQHDKLRANIREMLETPQQVRDYDKNYPDRRNKNSFAIWEDDTSAPELDSPLANSAGRMLDEIMSEKQNQKPIQSPFKFASPLKSFPLFPPVDENATWSLSTPSMTLSSPSSKYIAQHDKVSEYESENWIITENVKLDTALELDNFGSDDSTALDLTQTFRGIGEVPTGVEAFGPATLHRFG